MASQEWYERNIPVGEVELPVVMAGSGKPLLVLHDELGYTGWLRWQAALSKEHTLIIPMAPGFGRAPRIEWIESARDLVQYMVKRGQTTPEEADKLIREAEAAHDKRPASEKTRPTATKLRTPSPPATATTASGATTAAAPTPPMARRPTRPTNPTTSSSAAAART